jgi:putative ABC transport system permease protein
MEEVPNVLYRVVSGDYFRAIGMTLLRGRWLDERDVFGAPYVAVINETLAQRFWPGQDPIGKSFELGAPRALRGQAPAPPGYPPKFQVVGVVKDAKESGLNGPVQPAVYVSHGQGSEGAVGMFLAVRTTGDPMSVVGDVRQIVSQLDRDVPLTNIATMQQRLQESVANPRLQTILLGAFSALALLLAAVGIYGLMSYSVAQRRNEIGVRMALGAQPRQVLRLMLGSGIRLTTIGLLLGIAGGLVAGRMITSLLFQVRPTDASTFVAVSVVLGAVGLLASYVPARRATRVDPMVALRYE